MASGARGACASTDLGLLTMIGVIAEAREHVVVREFFELFKTPWEFYRKGEQYDALLCSGDCELDVNTKSVLSNSGRGTRFDVEQNVLTRAQRERCILAYQTDRIPIY